MSHDALSHLVQRTLQPEPAVGPRLPSRYEGWRGGPDTEIERDAEVTSPPPAAYRPSTNAEEPASRSPRAAATHEEPGPAEPDHNEAGVSRAGVTVNPDRTAVLPGKPPPPAEHVRLVEPLRAGQQHTNDPIPRAAPVAPATVVIPDEPPRPDPESVIHITIGRVEVRATPSSTPSRPPRQPSERRVMSLDEYLDRRGRGSSP
jgi:hypothetical protein